MNILLIPRVEINKQRNETNYALDIRLIKFLNTCFKTNNVFINELNLKNKIKIDLIVISGGNNLINKNKNDKLRLKISRKIIKFGLSKRIPILGICYGAQLISTMFGCKLSKVTGHVGINHYIYDKKSKRLVNSYHDYSIKLNNSKKIKTLFTDKKKNIEAFSKGKKVLGIMWHPERYNKLKKKDIQMVKNLCN